MGAPPQRAANTLGLRLPDLSLTLSLDKERGLMSCRADGFADSLLLSKGRAGKRSLRTRAFIAADTWV